MIKYDGTLHSDLSILPTLYFQGLVFNGIREPSQRKRRLQNGYELRLSSDFGGNSRRVFLLLLGGTLPAKLQISMRSRREAG